MTPRGEAVAGKRIGRIDVAGAPPEMLGQESVVQRQRSPRRRSNRWIAAQH